MKHTHQHQIIGHLNAHVEGDYAKIDDFSIVDSHQKKGFGTALMKAMLDELKKLHVKEVYLVTDLADTAKELYERMGYKQTGIFYHYIKMFKD
jgi:spore maturation protein CgeE